MSRAMDKEGQVIEGKMNWKGRPARKVHHGGTTASLLVLGLFAFDGFAIVAVIANLVTYFTMVMNLEIANASSAFTNLLGTSYILAVFLAFFADAYIGRSRVILIGFFIYLSGLVMLTVQAHTPTLKPKQCNRVDLASECEKIKGGDAAFLYIGLYAVAIGTAGVKSCVPAHGADQFDENDSQELASMSSYFNWLLLSACIGASFSLTFVVWIQTEVGWDWGFGVPTVGLFIGGLIFVSGVPRYCFHVIRGPNPITEIIQVFVVSIRNRKLHLPDNPEDLYEIRQEESAKGEEFLPHRNMIRFLDKAAISTVSSSTPSAWKQCRVTQVENAKTVLGILPIFGSAIIMSTCLAQIQTFTVQQGLTMDTRFISSFKIPPATMSIIPIGFLIFMVPLYDRVLVPILRSLTGLPRGITHLQRIGIGLMLSCLSMTIAAIIEVKRKKVAERHAMLDAIPVLQPLPISVFWLSFQYFIFGTADLFTFVGLLEFFYSEAPKKLKSTATSFKWCAMALGYFLNTVLVELVNSATKRFTKSGGWLAGNNLNRNHLDLFYWLLAFLTFINFLNYLFWARRYEYKNHNSLVFEGDVGP